MPKRRTRAENESSAANIGFEVKLWAAADALRNNMDAADYKHVVLGLIFLRSSSDAFAAKQAELLAQHAQSAEPENPDEYRAANISWVPKKARWSFLKASAPQPIIGRIVDGAMATIERERLRGLRERQHQGRRVSDDERP
jgi:type I restriction enzyme M protein